MSTYREVSYMVLDQLKQSFDDANYTEDHIVFLINKYRAFLLKQRYTDLRKKIPESNYQKICLKLQESGADCGINSEYLISVEPVPDMLIMGKPKLYTCDLLSNKINFMSFNRMLYAKDGKYSGSNIYGSIGPNKYIYLTSNNPQFKYLEEVVLFGIFEDPNKAASLDTSLCSDLDLEIPVEESLIVPIIQMIVQELSRTFRIPEDVTNDGQDDVSANTVASANYRARGYGNQGVQE